MTDRAMDDRELISLAAKMDNRPGKWNHMRESWEQPGGYYWNPLNDDGERYRLLLSLGMSIDSNDCCVWKRLHGGDLIQEFWGGEHGSEPRASLRAIAALAERTY